jgi:hypothetical protein
MFVGDLSISRYLVREGYAFAYRRYSKNLLRMKSLLKKIIKACGQCHLNILGNIEKKISRFLIFFLIFLPNKKLSKLKLNILKLKKYIFLTVYMWSLLIH